jgi:hypothetical protein
MIMIKFRIARELTPKFNLFSVKKLNIHLLLLFGSFDLYINFVLRFFDEPIIVFEVLVYFSSKPCCESIKSLLYPFIVSSRYFELIFLSRNGRNWTIRYFWCLRCPLRNLITSILRWLVLCNQFFVNRRLQPLLLGSRSCIWSLTLFYHLDILSGLSHWVCWFIIFIILLFSKWILKLCSCSAATS